ncbi:hypothetical protein BCR42DRAFT_400318 [Absidia repens]|uniref:Uncharacterized protein n=1 Tax=Absidia repens TaxID=90262 RepID=A0A1X2J2Q3_9FUNG|nr:hypothetical protein BCR42DRAFT_400318 [Absidia repens]
MTHFWSYAIQTHQWTPIDLPSNALRCGHSANLLDDGYRIAILGGFLVEKYQLLNNNGAPRVLANMSSVLLYDSLASQWSEQSTVGSYPKPRAYHTTVKSTDNSLIVVGGQDGTPPPYQAYLSSNGQFQDMVAILNTTTWQWQTVPGTSTMEQPLPQSKATGLMVDDHTLLYSFGTTYQTIYSGLYLFDTRSNAWISSGSERIDSNGNGIAVEQNVSSNGGYSETRHEIHIIVACIGSLCFVAVLILLYRMKFQWKRKLLSGLSLFKKQIWKPRIGEPSWTETVRLTLMLAYVCFFLFLILCLVDQVVNSPIIDQLSYIENPSATVTAPDIRFCLDDEHTVLRCGTDLGMQCSEYLIPMSTLAVHHRRHRNPYCYLFRPPPSFRLGQTSDRLASNGSYLKFDYYFGQPTQVEAAFYHPRHNPNLAVYSIPAHQDQQQHYPFTWNDPLEEMAFLSSEKKGSSLSTNIYQLDVNVVSSGSYELLQRVTLLDTFWNYVGFSPDVDTFYEIDTKVQSETGRSDYSSNPRPLGSFHVFPMHYEIKTLHEQRAFALVNATGVFGGLFGLLVSFQALLFGYRPRSPLGVVHRWSIGDMKRSLLHGLQKSFVPQNTNVPIVHPMRDETIMSTSRERSMMERKSTAATTMTTKKLSTTAQLSTSPSPPPPPVPPLPSTPSTSSATPSPPTLSPSPSIPPTYPAATLTRASPMRNQQPLPVFQDADAFVAEPESYDDDDDVDDDGWVFGAERLTRMEDRMEVLEKVFQAYYINDEVFTALEMALIQTETSHPRQQQQQQQRRRQRQSILTSIRQRTPFKQRQ